MSIADFPEQEARPGTYQTIVRPHQLRRTDVITETVIMMGPVTRNVVIEKVTAGEITYRGRAVPVLFVHGYDERLKHPVQYTRTGWEFIGVTRTGEAPQYRRALRNTDQYVY